MELQQLYVDDYINEANGQRNNKESCKEIPNDPTELNGKKVNNATKEPKSAGLLDKAGSLKSKNTGVFLCFRK